MDEKDILPKTTEGRKVSIASQSATNKKMAGQIEKLRYRIGELTAQFAWLNRQLFGRSSEKFSVYDPNMPDLFAEEFAGFQRQTEEP